MEHQLWKALVALLAQFGQPRFDPREDFHDQLIAQVWYGAVTHDRPVCWACQPRRGPPHRRRRRLPSGPPRSRRLRSGPVRELPARLEARVIAPQGPGVYGMIDGKPRPVGGCSQDRPAGYGRAAAGQAKGYQRHALVNPQGAVACWRVAPVNTDERVMARRLIRAAPEAVPGYVVTDSNYDPNPLPAQCQARPGGRLRPVNRRRYGPATATATASRRRVACGARSC